MEKKETKPRRLTMILRNDLAERLLKIAPDMGQNPNYFVNFCVEGCLDAMESDEISYEIPIIKLYRTLKRKTLLDAKWVTALCSLFAPNLEEITTSHRHFLAELINQHEGPLTPEAMDFYWKKATDLNKAHVQTLKETTQFKKKGKTK